VHRHTAIHKLSPPFDAVQADADLPHVHWYATQVRKNKKITGLCKWFYQNTLTSVTSGLKWCFPWRFSCS